jgi:uncharacterized protein (DUF1778 family)
MAKKRTVTITLRIEPETRDLLKLAGEKDHRSMANMVEVIILEYCEAKEISLAPKRAPGKGSAR